MFCRLRRAQQVVQESPLTLPSRSQKVCSPYQLYELSCKGKSNTWHLESLGVQGLKGIAVKVGVLGKVGFLDSCYPKICSFGGSSREVLEKQLERKVGEDAGEICERLFTAEPHKALQLYEKTEVQLWVSEL